MKKITTIGIAVLLGISGIAQTVIFEKEDKTVEFETASPKKWFQDAPKKIVVMGVRLEYDAYAGQSSDDVFMTVELQGLEKELLNDIGNQFYEDFKKNHEAKGYTVSVADIAKMKKNESFAKKLDKGKVRIIEGGDMVDNSDESRGKNRSVFIYPDKVPYIYAEGASGGGRGGCSYAFGFFNGLSRIVQPGEIGVLLCIKVNFYDFQMAFGVKGQTSLYLSSDPDKGVHPFDCMATYYVCPENGKYTGTGSVSVTKGKLKVEENDFVERVSDENNGKRIKNVVYKVKPEEFKTYNKALLNAFSEKSATLFDNHLKEVNSK